MKELFAAMAAAFPEIEGATKDSSNPHFKTKYADLGSVVDAIKPALIKHGLFFYQSTRDAEGGVCISTYVGHKSGESMDFGALFVPASKQDAQGYGSALTYARRYSLMTAFGVCPEDDDGNAARSHITQDVATANPRAPVEKGKDAPFPQGPARNITELRAIGRDLWRDIEAAEDGTHLDSLISTNAALFSQLERALPSWIQGGQDKHGQTFEGLQAVIDRLRFEFDQIATAQKLDTVRAG